MCLDLEHVNVLRSIQELKASKGLSIAEITECKFCGAFSESNSLRAALKFMRQHLYSHSWSDFFSCTICGYGSNRRYSVTQHIKKKHPEINGNFWKFWPDDHREELDEYLCKLSIKLYSNNDNNTVL